jgi:peptidoglycan/LPS O-acetylase OafA/YrhL
MTVSIPWSPSSPAARGRSRAALAAVVLVAAAAGFAAGAWGGPAAAAQAEPDLVRLMRFMAGVKALLAFGAAAAVVWRLGAPVTALRLAAYATAAAAMAAGPGLIWGMTHVVAGSVLLHGGLVATVLLLWRDPGTALWLNMVLTARRVRRLHLQ